MDIDPSSSGSVTIDTNPAALGLAAKGDVTVSLGSFHILHKTGSWQWSLEGHLSLSSPSTLKIKGLPISGTLDLATKDGGMDVTAQAGLGIKTINLTGDVVLHLDNQSGLSIENADVKVGEIPLGPLASIQGGSLAYTRTPDGHDVWSAKVSIKLPPGLPDNLAGDLELRDGQLSEISLSGSNWNRELAGIVFLQSLGLDVKLVPALDVTGSIGLTAGPEIPKLNIPAMSISASLEAKFGSPVVLTATGDLKLVGNVDLANTTVIWAIPNQFSATGHIGADVGPSFLHLHASADAKVAVAPNVFAVRGDGDISLPAGEGQGLVYISEKGIVALAYIHGPTVAGVTIAPVCAGVGYHWSGQTEWYADDGCAGAMVFKSGGNFADFNSAPKFTLAGHDPNLSSAGSYAVVVPPGLTQVQLGATAASGFPSFTLRSPSGEVIDAATAGTIGNLGHGTYLVVKDPVHKGTYVLVASPEAGSWTLTPTAGSPSITTIAQAHSAQPVRVVTHVLRHGANNVLTWKSTNTDGATLRFSDVDRFGDSTILSTSRSSGSRTFASVDDGLGGLHHVDILVTQNGLPQTIITGSSFTVPAPSPPAKAGAVSVSHQRNKVVVTWSAVPRAARYNVFLTTADGRRKYYALPISQRAITLNRVYSPNTVTASVSTVAADGLQSRSTTATLRLIGKRG